MLSLSLMDPNHWQGSSSQNIFKIYLFIYFLHLCYNQLLTVTVQCSKIQRMIQSLAMIGSRDVALEGRGHSASW